MRFIDNKGNIFGKINIIDATILIFFIILLFTGHKYLYLENYPENILDKVTSHDIFLINITVQQYTDIPTFLIDSASKGDIAYRQRNLEKNVTIAKITNIDEQEIYVGSQKKIQAIITYSVLVEKLSDGIYYENTKMKIGSEFLFETYTYAIKGTIIAMDNSDLKPK